MVSTEEQLKIAIDCLQRMANKEHIDKVSASMSQFGSAGAGMALGSVQKYAAETLGKMGVALVKID